MATSPNAMDWTPDNTYRGYHYAERRPIMVINNKRAFAEYVASQYGDVETGRSPTTSQAAASSSSPAATTEPQQVNWLQRFLGNARRYVPSVPSMPTWISSRFQFSTSTTPATTVQAATTEEAHTEYVDNKRRRTVPGAWPESPSPLRRRSPLVPRSQRRSPQPVATASPITAAHDDDFIPASPTPAPRVNAVIDSIRRSTSPPGNINGGLQGPNFSSTATSSHVGSVIEPLQTRRSPITPTTPSRLHGGLHGPNISSTATPSHVDSVIEPLPTHQSPTTPTRPSRLHGGPQDPTIASPPHRLRRATPHPKRQSSKIVNVLSPINALSPIRGSVPRVSPRLHSILQRYTPYARRAKHDRHVHFRKELMSIKLFSKNGICGAPPSPILDTPGSSPSSSQTSTPSETTGVFQIQNDQNALADNPSIALLDPSGSSPSSSQTSPSSETTGVFQISDDQDAPADISPEPASEDTRLPPSDLESLVEKYDFLRLSEGTRAARRRKAEAERKLIEEERVRREAEERRRSRLAIDLSDEWNDKVDIAMASSASKQLGPSKSFTRRDLGTLLPQSAQEGIGWLNDEVINQFVQHIVDKRLKDTGYNKALATDVPRYHAFNSNLYNTWKSKGYAGVARWAKRAKIDGKRFLEVEQCLIPINNVSHWTEIAISGKKRTIAYYDSLWNNPGHYTSFALDFVRGVLGDAFVEDEWKIIDASSSQQANGVDCGVFVCMNALALALGRDPCKAFSADDAEAARRFIAAVLLNGGFSGIFKMA